MARQYGDFRDIVDEDEGLSMKESIIAYSLFLASFTIGFGGAYGIIDEPIETTSGSPKQEKVMIAFQDASALLISQYNEIRGIDDQRNVTSTMNALNSIGNTEDVANNALNIERSDLTHAFNNDVTKFFDALAFDANIPEQAKADLIETLGNGGINILEYTGHDEINPAYLTECRISNGNSANSIYECTDYSNDSDWAIILLLGGAMSAGLMSKVVKPLWNSERVKKMVKPKPKAKNY